MFAQRAESPRHKGERLTFVTKAPCYHDVNEGFRNRRELLAGLWSLLSGWRFPGRGGERLKIMRWLLVVAFAFRGTLAAGTAADLGRAIRENGFDRDECYRVRDVTIFKEDLRIYLADGHLIFSKPLAGHRIAAVFLADVEGGDGEVILLPPNRAERVSLASYTNAPNLDEHFRSALFLFTGTDYDALLSQLPKNASNRK
jgi:hypothetical protein